MHKVKSGDPLTIPSETFNTFVDAARDFRERQQSSIASRQPERERNGIVLLKNASGSDRNRFDILGIDSPVIEPAENLNEFQNRVALNGSIPSVTSHAGKFAILQEPVKADGIARAMLVGVTPVRVNVTDTSHAFADLTGGNASQLASSASSGVRILWKESGTGLLQAVVELPPVESGSLEVMEDGVSVVTDVTRIDFRCAYDYFLHVTDQGNGEVRVEFRDAKELDVVTNVTWDGSSLKQTKRRIKWVGEFLGEVTTTITTATDCT